MVYKWCRFSAYHSPKLVNGKVKQLAMLLLQLPKSWGLKVWLMPRALIPLIAILADQVELVVCVHVSSFINFNKLDDTPQQVTESKR